MSDPLSIISGVAGVISLGLQVGQGLYEFVQSVQEANASLRRIGNSCLNLQSILNELQPVLQHPWIPATEKEMVESSLLSCQEIFATVHGMIQPFLQVPEEREEEKGVERAVNEGGVTRGMKRMRPKHLSSKILKLLLWPFKVAETDRLMTMVDQSVNRLTLALNAVQSNTALKTLEVNERALGMIEASGDITTRVHVQTTTIEQTVTSHSHTLKRIHEDTSTHANNLQARLDELQAQQRKSDEETQRLLSMLVSQLSQKSLVDTASATHALDPLARAIMQKTIGERPVKYLREKDPPPAYTYQAPPAYQMPSPILASRILASRKDYEWDTPFGRIQMTTAEQKEGTKGTALKYSIKIVPATWLYNKAAAFAFLRKADGFGIHFTTPATFKADEPVLKYLRKGYFLKLREAIASNPFLLHAVNDYSGRTLLAEAVRCRRVDAVKYLLELGADPEVEDRWGQTLYNLLFTLNIKAYYSWAPMKIFRILLGTQADLFRGRATVLHSAATASYLNFTPKQIDSILKTVYSSTAHLTSIDEVDHRGRSVLEHACYNAHDNATVISFLIEKGAKITFPAFDAAAKTGHIATARVLVQHGMKLNLNSPTTRRDGRTLMHNFVTFAMKNRGEELAAGWRDDMAYLISQGADINARDIEGRTPLHVATLGSYCDEDLLRDLTDLGADASIPDNDGQTALMLAKGHVRYERNSWRYMRGLKDLEVGMYGEKKDKDTPYEHEDLPDDEEWARLGAPDKLPVMDVDEGVKYRGVPRPEVHKRSSSWVLETLGYVLRAFV